jgi:hypothetical protein
MAALGLSGRPWQLRETSGERRLSRFAVMLHPHVLFDTSRSIALVVLMHLVHI